MKTGLVSVTFRQLAPKQIISLCKEAGLDGIEWGTDVHLTDPKTASEVRTMMEGLETLSLGSYYHIGTGMDFAQILATAKAIQAPNIRVWAGNRNPEEYTAEERMAAVKDAKEIAKMAASEGITVSFEYHGNTLTANQCSAMRLMEEIDEANFRLYWQPLYARSQEAYLSEVREISDAGWLENLHVYTWRGAERLDLEADGALWEQRLSAGTKANAAILEFVKGDDPKQFLKDAAWLRETLKKIQKD